MNQGTSQCPHATWLSHTVLLAPHPHTRPIPWTHLGRCGVKRCIKDVGFLPGAAGMQDIIRVLHGVSQHHNLLADTNGAA